MNPLVISITNEVLCQVLGFINRRKLYELSEVNQNFNSIVSNCFSHYPYQVVVYLEFVNGECFIGASVGSLVRVLRGAQLQQLLETMRAQKYLRIGHTSISLTSSLEIFNTEIFQSICHVWSGKTLEFTFSNPSTYPDGIRDSLNSLNILTKEFIPGLLFLKIILIELEYEHLPHNTPILPVTLLADWLSDCRNGLKFKKFELFTKKCNESELGEITELLKTKFSNSTKPTAFKFVWVQNDDILVRTVNVQNTTTNEEFKTALEYVNGSFRYTTTRKILETKTT